MSSNSASKMKVVFTGLMVLAFVFTCLGVSSGAVYAQDDGTDSSDAPTPPAEISGETTTVISPYYAERTLTTADGKSLTVSVINAPSKPEDPASIEKIETFPATAKKLSNVPAYSWVFGCSAVSGSMIAGYYDRISHFNMYTGPTNSGVTPLTDTAWPTWSDGYDSYPNNPLIASHKGIDGRSTKGSIDDYWVESGDSGLDPYMTGSWTQHTWGTAIGDYMKTSQYYYGNTDGSTSFYNYTSSKDKLTCADMESYGIAQMDGTYGRKLFYQARGYAVSDCYSQKTDNTITGGFSFSNYVAEINAGNPVMLNLAGHTVVGMGYDTATKKVYIHDTWGNYTTSFTWGTSYSGRQLLSVSIVHLKPVTKPTLKSPISTSTTKTPTYKWSKVYGATKYQIELYSGTTKLISKTLSSSICTTTTCSYKIAKTLSNGKTYKWRVRAYLSGSWKPYTSFGTFKVTLSSSVPGELNLLAFAQGLN